MLKILLALTAIVILVLGIFGGVYFIRQKQLIAPEAVVPQGGTTQIFLGPQNQTVAAGTTFAVNVIFDSSTEIISGATVSLSYPYSPAISIMEVLPNQDLVNQEQWRYQQKTFTREGDLVKISIIATDTTIEGYQHDGETVLATLNFQANSPGNISLTFDNADTKLSSKTTGADILSAPQSPAGTYTVQGQSTTPVPTSPPANTPIPTTIPPANNPTPTTASTGSTPRPTTPPSTVTTPPQTLPVAGNPLPTLGLILLGLTILGSGALILKRPS